MPQIATLSIIAAAKEAARIALDVREKKHLNAQMKDGNPNDVVTTADTAVQNYLQKALPAFINNAPVGFMGEEGEQAQTQTPPADGALRWCVDPIDGTKPFANGEPYFSVSIALQEMRGGQWHSKTGVIYCASEADTAKELKGKIYWAEEGQGAYTRNLAEDGSDSKIEKPRVIAKTVEYDASAAEAPNAELLQESATYAALAKPILADQGYQTKWRRSIAYAAMECLDGKKAAAMQPTAGCFDWDVAAVSLIAKEAGANIACGPAVAVEGKNRYPLIIAWDNELFAKLVAPHKHQPAVASHITAR